MHLRLWMKMIFRDLGVLLECLVSVPNEDMTAQTQTSLDYNTCLGDEFDHILTRLVEFEGFLLYNLFQRVESSGSEGDRDQRNVAIDDPRRH